jgi:glycosyltransferase involved in cell wall biosynthesis
MSTILIISPEPWDGHFVSKHHYACELVRRGHQVLFYGPPDAMGPMRLEPVTDAQADLRVLRAPRVARGLRFMPSGLRRALEARWLGQVERLAGTAIDVVWNFENSRFFDMNFAGKRLKIYHQVDLKQNFHPSLAAKTADYVFCSSKPIRERLAQIRPDASIIHHGVQEHRFDQVSETPLLPKSRTNCVYTGNMSIKCIDRDLILRCIESFPDVMFHFFGGFAKNDPFEIELKAWQNVRLHGKVASHRIPPILANADILLVTYQKSDSDNNSNPHKMMEYMMSGKVIVATYTSEYERVNDLLVMCTLDGDYVELLGKVIRSVDAWNTPEVIEKRKAFAADNTYSRQLDRISAALGPKGYLVN